MWYFVWVVTNKIMCYGDVDVVGQPEEEEEGCGK